MEKRAPNMPMHSLHVHVHMYTHVRIFYCPVQSTRYYLDIWTTAVHVAVNIILHALKVHFQLVFIVYVQVVTKMVGIIHVHVQINDVPNESLIITCNIMFVCGPCQKSNIKSVSASRSS